MNECRGGLNSYREENNLYGIMKEAKMRGSVLALFYAVENRAEGLDFVSY